MKKTKEQMNLDIWNHGENLKAFFGLEGDPVKLCRCLRRLEEKSHNLATYYCNHGATDEEVDEIDKKVMESLGKIIGPENAKKCFFNLDARGYALKIDEKNSKVWTGHRDWGGYGILAPDLSE